MASTVKASASSKGNIDESSLATSNGNKKPERVTSKNAKRRQKKKEQRETGSAPINAPASENDNDSKPVASSSKAPSTLTLSAITLDDEAIPAEYAQIFSRFQSDPSSSSTTRLNGREGEHGDGKGEVIYSDDDQLSEEEEEEEENKRLSKRKQRKLRRLTVAELKQMVKKPELVDWEDVTATDPQLLIQLKSTRNTIPIPPHWSLKREYLQNRKGIEKPQFQLPSYIAATGIAEIKDALKEKESEQTLKAKTRERVQPKMGKVVIDYQKLHDAFFRFQTKPESLTRFGEVYYEGKESETKFKERRPGELSNELKEALSIPPLAPPPWLIAMQRFGPPPSYPQLRIAGLNAPIPEGAQWGFHPGGWGRPPMDEYGNPLFGNVLGQSETQQKAEAELYGEEPEREPFGELEPEEEADTSEEDEEEDEEEEENDDEQQHDRQRGLETPADGLETPRGMQSVASSMPGGLETPGFLELRKGARAGGLAAGLGERDDGKAANGGQQHLYQVLPEREVSNAGRGFLSGDHAYDLSQMGDGGGANDAAAIAPAVLGAEDAAVRGTKRKAATINESVNVNLDASELDGMTDEQLASRYEKARQAAMAHSHAGNDAQASDLALLREELQRKRQAKEAKRIAGK